MTGTVYWQAEFAGRPEPNVIKAVVGEDWILEKLPSGDLKFVLYTNTFHHALPRFGPSCFVNRRGHLANLSSNTREHIMTDTPEYTPPEVWVWEKGDSPQLAL